MYNRLSEYIKLNDTLYRLQFQFQKATFNLSCFYGTY